MQFIFKTIMPELLYLGCPHSRVIISNQARAAYDLLRMYLIPCMRFTTPDPFLLNKITDVIAALNEHLHDSMLIHRVGSEIDVNGESGVVDFIFGDPEAIHIDENYAKTVCMVIDNMCKYSEVRHALSIINYKDSFNNQEELSFTMLGGRDSIHLEKDMFTPDDWKRLIIVIGGDPRLAEDEEFLNKVAAMTIKGDIVYVTMTSDKEMTTVSSDAFDKKLDNMSNISKDQDKEAKVKKCTGCSCANTTPVPENDPKEFANAVEKYTDTSGCEQKLDTEPTSDNVPVSEEPLNYNDGCECDSLDFCVNECDMRIGCKEYRELCLHDKNINRFAVTIICDHRKQGDLVDIILNLIGVDPNTVVTDSTVASSEYSRIMKISNLIEPMAKRIYDKLDGLIHKVNIEPM